MSNSKNPLLTLTVLAAAALTAKRFVTGAGAVATAANRAVGVVTEDAAIGEVAPVDVLGTTLVEAGDAIAADEQVEVGANGKAVPLAAGVPVGRAAPGATADADGDVIEILLIPN